MYGWVTLDEYADLCQLTKERVKEHAERGDLGVIEKHPMSGLDIVFWPLEKWQIAQEKLLKVGDSSYALKVTRPGTIGVDVDPNDRESLPKARSHLVYLGRKVFRDPERASSEAEELLLTAIAHGMAVAIMEGKIGLR